MELLSQLACALVVFTNFDFAEDWNVLVRCVLKTNYVLNETVQ